MSSIFSLEAEVFLYSNNETYCRRNEENQEMCTGAPPAHLCWLVFTCVYDDMAFTSSVKKPERDMQTTLCSWVVFTCGYEMGVRFLQGHMVLRGDLQHVVSVWDKQEDGGVFLITSQVKATTVGCALEECTRSIRLRFCQRLRLMSNQFWPFQWWVFFPPLVTRCETSCRSDRWFLQRQTFSCAITRFPL